MLLLASKSKARQLLLQQSKISFGVINQLADESLVDHSQDLDKVVLSIAQLKLDHAVLPPGMQDKFIYVLTADTLTQDYNKIIHGKPKDYQDAVSKIKALRGLSYVATGFCLEKKLYQNNSWITVAQEKQVVIASCYFNVPDYLIDKYLKNSCALEASGAITIEEYGMQFLKFIEGSYSAILGLPIYEVRESLERLGFFGI